MNLPSTPSASLTNGCYMLCTLYSWSINRWMSVVLVTFIHAGPMGVGLCIQNVLKAAMSLTLDLAMGLTASSSANLSDRMDMSLEWSWKSIRYGSLWMCLVELHVHHVLLSNVPRLCVSQWHHFVYYSIIVVLSHLYVPRKLAEP